MTFGLENLSDTTANASTNSTGFNITASSNELGNLIENSVAGNTEYVGIIALILFIVILWKSDVNLDVSMVVMLPLVFILGTYDYLPAGQGIVYGLILAVAGLFAFGLMRWL